MHPFSGHVWVQRHDDVAQFSHSSKKEVKIMFFGMIVFCVVSLHCWDILGGMNMGHHHPIPSNTIHPRPFSTTHPTPGGICAYGTPPLVQLTGIVTPLAVIVRGSGLWDPTKPDPMGWKDVQDIWDSGNTIAHMHSLFGADLGCHFCNLMPAILSTCVCCKTKEMLDLSTTREWSPGTICRGYDPMPLQDKSFGCRIIRLFTHECIH